MHPAFAAFSGRAATSVLNSKECRIVQRLMDYMSYSYQDTTSSDDEASEDLYEHSTVTARGAQGERAHIFTQYLQELLRVHLPDEQAVLQPASSALVGQCACP